MSSNPLRLQYLFEKYQRNVCSKKELQEFWQLLNELSEEDLLQDALFQLYQQQTPGKQPADEVNWKKFNQKLQKKMVASEVDLTKFARKYTWWRPWAAAAILVGLIALGGFWLQYSNRDTAPAAVAKTKPVSHQVINLPDGTTVTLNEGSKLDYPQTFNGNTREVYLAGEAYFDVKHNPQKPFLVHTGKYITQVLGTAFNVKAYAQDAEVAITVVQGKVQVSDYKHQVLSTLLPDDQLVVNKKTGAFRQQKMVAARIIEWIAEDLIFEDITMGEAAIQISHRFGVEIRFDNEALRNCRFTASFQNEGITLKEVMDAITILTRSRWEKENNTSILLEGEGCK